MRKFGIFYSELHPQYAEVKKAFIAVKTAADWLKVLDQWYTENAPGRFPPVEKPNPLSLETPAV